MRLYDLAKVRLSSGQDRTSPDGKIGREDISSDFGDETNFPLIFLSGDETKIEGKAWNQEQKSGNGTRIR